MVRQMRADGSSVSEFRFTSPHPGAAPLTAAVLSPATPAPEAAHRGVLVVLAADRMSLLEGPQGQLVADTWVGAGYHVVGLDLPSHGDREDPLDESLGTDGIAAWAAAQAVGVDRFEEFVAEGSALIDALIGLELGVAGRIFVYGVSRGGYMALRLAAADERVAAVAGIAPVTDWRYLSEFAAIAESEAVAAVALEGFADKLAARPVWLAIGNHDSRVSSAACLRLATAILELEALEGSGVGEEDSQLVLHLVDDSPGHSLADEWRTEGARWLLRLAQAAGSSRL